MEIGSSSPGIPPLNHAPGIFLCKGFPEVHLYPKVSNGEDVCIAYQLGGKKGYLRADFAKLEAMQERLGMLTPEIASEFFEKAGKLAEQFPSLGEQERKLIYDTYQTTLLVKNILGSPNDGSERLESIAKCYHPGQNCNIKPLSDCIGMAACSEYAIVSHHVLSKLGIPSSILVGAIFTDGEIHPHTYLLLNEGKLIFDPTRSATQENCWLPKIYQTEKPMTTDFLKQAAREKEYLYMPCKNIINGNTAHYGF